MQLKCVLGLSQSFYLRVVLRVSTEIQKYLLNHYDNIASDWKYSSQRLQIIMIILAKSIIEIFVSKLAKIRNKLLFPITDENDWKEIICAVMKCNGIRSLPNSVQLIQYILKCSLFKFERNYGILLHIFDSESEWSYFLLSGHFFRSFKVTTVNIVESTVLENMYILTPKRFLW